MQCSRAAQCFQRFFLSRRSTPGETPNSIPLLPTRLDESSRSQSSASEARRPGCHPELNLSEVPDLRKSSSESAKWLNELVRCSWEHIEEAARDAIQKLLTPERMHRFLEKQKIHPAFQGILLGDNTLQNCCLGRHPPEISEIHVQRTDRGIKLRGRLVFDSEVDISLQTANLGTWTIEHLKVDGRFVICMEPFLQELPIFGAVCLYFLDQPVIEPKICSSMPGLNYFVSSMIAKNVAQQVVLPNAETINLAKHEKFDRALLTMHPRGVLRVSILSGRDLKAGDIRFLEANTSDPYVIVKVGDMAWQSKTVYKTCYPKWEPGESHDFVVYDMKQHIAIEVWDEDMITPDDSLGCTRLQRVQNATGNSGEVLWEKLYDKADENCQTGQGHLQLRFTWFKLDDLSKCATPEASASEAHRLGSSYLAMFRFGKLSSADFSKVSLTVKLGNKEVKAFKKKARAISWDSRKLTPLVKKMAEDQRNLTLQDISEITQMPVDHVMDVLDREGLLTARLQGSVALPAARSAIDHVLYIPVSSDYMNPGTTFDVELEGKINGRRHRGRTTEKMKKWLDKQAACAFMSSNDKHHDCNIAFDGHSHPDVKLGLAVTFLQLLGDSSPEPASENHRQGVASEEPNLRPSLVRFNTCSNCDDLDMNANDEAPDGLQPRVSPDASEESPHEVPRRKSAPAVSVTGGWMDNLSTPEANVSGGWLDSLRGRFSRNFAASSSQDSLPEPADENQQQSVTPEEQNSRPSLVRFHTCSELDVDARDEAPPGSGQDAGEESPHGVPRWKSSPASISAVGGWMDSFRGRFSRTTAASSNQDE